MAKFLLSPTTLEHIFTTEFPVNLETGEMVKNRKLEPEDQVVATYETPSPRKQERYKTVTTDLDGQTVVVIDYVQAIIDNCTGMRGLDDFKVTNGKELIKHKPTLELNEMITELGFVIMGHFADPDKKVKDKKDAADDETEEEVSSSSSQESSTS